jgi:hypothetical protein
MNKTEVIKGIRARKPSKRSAKRLGCYDAMEQAGYTPTARGGPDFFGFDQDRQHMACVYALPAGSDLQGNRLAVAKQLSASGAVVLVWDEQRGIHRFGAE